MGSDDTTISSLNPSAQLVGYVGSSSNTAQLYNKYTFLSSYDVRSSLLRYGRSCLLYIREKCFVHQQELPELFKSVDLSLILAKVLNASCVKDMIELQSHQAKRTRLKRDWLRVDGLEIPEKLHFNNPLYTRRVDILKGKN